MLSPPAIQKAQNAIFFTMDWKCHHAPAPTISEVEVAVDPKKKS